MPQGSVIGPILFNYFTVDLPDIVSPPSYNMLMTQFFYREVYTDNDCHLLQIALNNILLRCIDNDMALNSSKCKVMHITRSRKLITTVYSTDGNRLDVV